MLFHSVEMLYWSVIRPLFYSSLYRFSPFDVTSAYIPTAPLPAPHPPSHQAMAALTAAPTITNVPGTIPLNAALAAAPQPQAPLSPVNPGFTLFVYNLAPETDDRTLWQLFGPCGAVLSVRVINDLETGKCKGFGFVTMSEYQEAALAISRLNGFTIGDRTLQVSFKTHPSLRKSIGTGVYWMLLCYRCSVSLCCVK